MRKDDASADHIRIAFLPVLWVDFVKLTFVKWVTGYNSELGFKRNITFKSCKKYTACHENPHRQVKAGEK